MVSHGVPQKRHLAGSGQILAEVTRAKTMSKSEYYDLNVAKRAYRPEYYYSFYSLKTRVLHPWTFG